MEDSDLLSTSPEGASTLPWHSGCCARTAGGRSPPAHTTRAATNAQPRCVQLIRDSAHSGEQMKCTTTVLFLLRTALLARTTVRPQGPVSLKVSKTARKINFLPPCVRPLGLVLC